MGVEGDDHELRDAWARFCAETNEEYARARYSEGALLVIASRYAALSAMERAVVDSVLIEQLAPREPRADDPWYVGENERFDALALVDQFAIVSAVPALRELAAWLEEQSTPGAPYEWAKVNRILGKLATARGAP